MKRLLIGSVTLNVILLGVGACAWFRQQPFVRSSAAPPTVKVVPVPPQPTAVQPFSWSRIEARDYPSYIRNLRAIGCPEETIRDIITADVANRERPDESTALPVGFQRLASSASASAGTPLPIKPAPEQRRLVASLLASGAGAPAANLSASPATVPAGPTSANAPASGLSFAATPVIRAATGVGGAVAGGRAAVGGGTGTPATNGTLGETAADSISADTRRATEEFAAATRALPTSAPGGRSPATQLFTPEELLYRAKFGWAAFYAAKQANDRAQTQAPAP